MPERVGPVRSARPTPAELLAAREKLLPDLIAPALSVLFVGINPGLYSAAVGHHFARPGNRFWPTLARAGFTPRVFSPREDADLLALGIGLTNVVARTTARAEELSRAELLEGAQELTRKVETYAPGVVAILGVTAYRSAFERPRAQLGLQAEPIGDARVVVLPNPSGLNAHHSLSALVEHFAALRMIAS